jgi:ABC-type uncharacterized transport system substrate-binding protein
MSVKQYYRSGMAGLMLGILLGSSSLQAHPHHWIDIFAEWQFDTKGLISGVKLRWLFDDYYSVLLVNDAGTSQKELETILNKILSNIAKHHYFVQIEQARGAADFAIHEQTRIGMQDHRIEIEFLLPLKEPLDPSNGDIVYRIGEPTYYFEMLHAEADSAILLKDAPPECGYHLQPPKPDAALVAYAASLGIDETGEESLGIQFAETVTISCK